MAKSELHEKLGQELRCALCLDVFTEPKVLPCLHTFCQQCIEEMMLRKTHDKNILDCPTCREPYPLPEASDVKSQVAKVRTNFTLKNLTQVLQSDVSVTRCNNGIDDNPAVCYCTDCRTYLCQSCKEMHSKQKATHRHALCSVDEVKKDEGRRVTPVQVQFCSEHTTEEIALYCFQCRNAICRDCTLITHAKHDLKFIKKMGDYFETRLKNNLSLLREKETEFADHRCYVQGVEAALDDHFKVSKDLIENTFSTYKKKMDECQAQLLGELALQYHSDRKAASAEKEKLELVLTKLSTNIVFCKQLLQSGDDVERAVMDTTIVEKVTSIRGEMWDKGSLTASSWTLETSSVDAFLRAHTLVATNLHATSFTLEDCKNSHVGVNQVTLKGVGCIPDAAIGTLLIAQVMQIPSDTKEAVMNSIPVNIVKVGSNCWKCTYFLERRGQYTVKVLCNGIDVCGSPARCNAQKMLEGTRVCRGSDWKWGLQDIGTGVGKVTVAKDDGWVTVAWDKGANTNKYRWGAEGAYDVCPKEETPS